jgi:hypothetical protein
MKNIFCLIRIIIFLSSCNSQNDELFKFDPRNLEENNISLSQIADSISYIPFDNSFLMGQVHTNFQFTGNSIYFSVTYEGIFEFGRDGKFIRKIGSIGRGPGEYITYINFSVDNKRGLIYVLDNLNKSSPIKVYSKEGKFVKSIPLPEYIDNIGTSELFSSKLVIFYNMPFKNSKYNWIVFDTLGKVIKKKVRSIPEVLSGWSGSIGTYKFKNNLGYWDTYNDTVFSISPDLTYKASFIISPGEHRAPLSIISDPHMLQQYMLINNIFETEQFIEITYYYKNPFVLLLEKKTNKIYLLKLDIVGNGMGTHRIGGIQNDLDGGPAFIPRNYFEENGSEYMVGLLYPYQIKSVVLSNEFKNTVPKIPEKKKELEKLANSLKETDNPVLMLVRLKK